MSTIPKKLHAYDNGCFTLIIRRMYSMVNNSVNAHSRTKKIVLNCVRSIAILSKSTTSTLIRIAKISIMSKKRPARVSASKMISCSVQRQPDSGLSDTRGMVISWSCRDLPARQQPWLWQLRCQGHPGSIDVMEQGYYQARILVADLWVYSNR